MDLRFSYDLDGIDWEAVAEIFKLAPLGEREPGKLRRACENSYLVCFAFFEEQLVGMGRAISDGEYHAAIYDLVVLPEFQGRGVGRRIMEELHRRLPKGTTIIYAAPGKEAFYAKLGYNKMLTAMARREENADSFRANGYID